MKKPRQDAEEPLHDRALLLHGRKRNKVLTLEEVQRYGSDSFSDPDYIRLYGMTPPQWYVRGARLLGRTPVRGGRPLRRFLQYALLDLATRLAVTRDRVRVRPQGL